MSARQFVISRSMPSSSMRRRLAAVDLDVHRRGDGEQAHLAGLDLVDDLRQPGDADVDRAGEDRRVGLAAAGVRDVAGLGGVGAERASRARRAAAGRCCPPSRRRRLTEPGSRSSASARSSQRLEVRLGRHDDRLRLGDHRGDRRGGVERHVGLVGLDRAEHHQPGHHQLVRVAGVLGDELGEPERAARALDVVDLDAVVELRVARGGLEGARGAVPAAAGRGGGHDPQTWRVG